MSSEPSAADWAIRAQGLGKTYRLYDKPHHRLLQSLWRGRRTYHREFNALSDVSFELARGQTLGIIGRNGAGKSTLLQLICGTLTPSAGQVAVQGRIAALLELGTGFNPDFTGRENIAINAAILGLSPGQVAECTPDIIGFADIGDHIDQPVKTYSSGMYVRLAFAVAIHAQPDILIVDEALSVGDALFQAKCMTRMRRMLDDGMTLLFTSHDIGAIKAICQRALWLEGGRLRMIGAAADVTRAYDHDWVAEANRAQKGNVATDFLADAEPSNAGTEGADLQRTGTGDVRVQSVGFASAGMSHASQVRVAHGEVVQMHLMLTVRRACRHLVVSYHVKNAQNQHVLGTNTAQAPALYDQAWAPGDQVSVRFHMALPLHAGNYTVTCLVASMTDTQRYTDAVFHDWVDDAVSLQVAPRAEFPVSDLVELPNPIDIHALRRPAPLGQGVARWVILDDFFPNLLSAFRIAEYNAFMAAMPGLTVHTTSPAFADRHAEYATLYPAWAARVQAFTPACLRGVQLAYLNFLNNAHQFLPAITEAGVPFVLTLYPGGGFGLHEPESDAKLLAVLASPLLQALVVTQPVTQLYLQGFAAAKGLSLPPVHLVPGLVVHPHHWSPQCKAHGPYFGAGKPTLDVCFVAEKYMARAENKGYPVFVEAAHALADLPGIRFHVVGSLTPDDLDVSALGDRIRFHGRLETVALQDFFAGQDLIISPNQPGKLHPGNFDGFPTGCCVEASLSGVAMLVTDALQQNPGYEPGRDAWILPPVADAIESLVRELHAQPERIARVATSGQQASRQRYHPEAQIAPRLQLLQSLLALPAQPPAT